MFKKIIEFFTGKKTAPEVVAPGGAPYKVEAPAVISPPANEPPKCGCGRSSTGLCVGLHKLSPEAWAEHLIIPTWLEKLRQNPQDQQRSQLRRNRRLRSQRQRSQPHQRKQHPQNP